MRILRPVVSPSAGTMPMLDPKITRGGVVRSQVVRDQSLRQEAIFLQEFAHQFQRCGLIPLGLDQDIQNLSFAIDGAPEISQASINLEIDFVQMLNSLARPALEHAPRRSRSSDGRSSPSARSG